MSEPFIGEIKMFPFYWPPRGWATCTGTLLPINDNQALYSLIGDMYGGDGRTNMALPDLRGRAPMSHYQEVSLGTMYGFEYIRLTSEQIPSHTHTMGAVSTLASTTTPTGSLLAGTADDPIHKKTTTVVSMESPTTSSGGSQPHYNMQPSLVTNFCIALLGLFPSRN